MLAPSRQYAPAVLLDHFIYQRPLSITAPLLQFVCHRLLPFPGRCRFQLQVPYSRFCITYIDTSNDYPPVAMELPKIYNTYFLAIISTIGGML